MAKNKVFLMVFVALLAGFAVLIGCTGEGVGDDAKSAGNSMNVTGNPDGETPVVLPEIGDEEEPPEIFNPVFPPPPRQELGTFPGLDVETERQLKLDYANWRSTVDYIPILNYFGNYNGCELVRMEGGAILGVVTKVAVAGMVFAFPNPEVTLVWKQGEDFVSGRFYELNEAYDLGFLTLGDIENLYKQHYEVWPGMKKFAVENISLPIPE